MARINENYLKLKAGYLFPEIGRRVRQFQENNPQAKIIRLGIGDVVLPLPQTVVSAFESAVREMGTKGGFHGYGPEQGYDFLREAIAANDYSGMGIAEDEIFVSDGSKCDAANIQELFAADIAIGIPDPVYPVYLDTNVMAGRTGAAGEDGRYTGISYLPATEATGFAPMPPKEPLDVVYLCSPNNPTGATFTRDALHSWVDYAKKHDSLIIFDAAYEAFIRDPELPHSIYEIPGARDCAIEMRSYSKTAGFTGTRCAFMVVPKSVMGKTSSGEAVSLHQLWNRRHCTKFNGVSYPVQRAAAAIYSAQGRAEIAEIVDYYMENARLIRQGLSEIGIRCWGGDNAPYVWLKTPGGSSWKFFDELLERCNVVGTPGAGFGACGEGYFRLSAFAMRDNVEEALARVRQQLA